MTHLHNSNQAEKYFQDFATQKHYFSFDKLATVCKTASLPKAAKKIMVLFSRLDALWTWSLLIYLHDVVGILFCDAVPWCAKTVWLQSRTRGPVSTWTETCIYRAHCACWTRHRTAPDCTGPFCRSFLIKWMNFRNMVLRREALKWHCSVLPSVFTWHTLGRLSRLVDDYFLTRELICASVTKWRSTTTFDRFRPNFSCYGIHKVQTKLVVGTSWLTHSAKTIFEKAYVCSFVTSLCYAITTTYFVKTFLMVSAR